MNIPPFHIPFRRLVDLVEGDLPAEERARLLAHVSGCPRCSPKMAWLERKIGVMRADVARDAPAPVVARAVRLFRSRAAQASPDLRERVLASLRFDSAGLTPAPGMRAGQPVARQLLFSAGEYGVELELAPQGEMWTVSGQVLGPAAAGLVELRGPTGTIRAALNDLSEFYLPPTPAGSYTLILDLADLEAEIQGLELGNRE